ncbi:MAG: DegT/DnrJ/EryC1/StrS aminotransferase family protein [Chitinivibrionales bacterium]|nr:DegT/DnrJ/EryC1/StrS aminotransferase family protein [Chitinivibrionales bacterium]
MQFIDLKAQYKRIDQSIQKRINTVLDHGSFIMGPEIKELEQKLAAFTGAHYCFSCSSGTDALLLALMAYKIGPGDAVLTSPFTFIATAEVIALLGATPVYVDIDPKTFNIDPEKLRTTLQSLKKGTKPSSKSPLGLKPKAIIPVDIFGLPANYDPINQIAKEFNCVVIEDAAQSFGGSYHGKMVCNLSEIACTSFFPAKPLGCYGDGGAVFTNNKEIANLIESLRVHGKGSDKYDNIRIGINGRLDTIQAAILLSKLEIFPEEIELRQDVAQRYTRKLSEVVQTPLIPEGYISAWAQYSILTEKRQPLMNKLKEKNIPTMIYYPKPLHLQTAFAYLGYEKGSMPVSEKISDTIFSLPMHPYLDEKEQNEIIASILKN